MSLDPIDYDVVELREMARRRGDQYLEDGFLWPEPSEGFPPLNEFTDVDHEPTWTGSLEERQKPYLEALPESNAGQPLIKEWVSRLAERAGFEGTLEALAYYEALGWITEAVQDELRDYLLAAGHHPEGSFDALDRGDHVDSLARVVALAQMADTPSGNSNEELLDALVESDIDAEAENDEIEDDGSDERPEYENDEAATSESDETVESESADPGETENDNTDDAQGEAEESVFFD